MTTSKFSTECTSFVGSPNNEGSKQIERRHVTKICKVSGCLMSCLCIKSVLFWW